jgi:hypothetical protein
MEPTVDELDISGLGTSEQRVLELSFRPSLKEKGVRNVMLSALIALSAVVVFSVYGVGVVAMTSMTVLIVAISAFEKITYSREMLVYKSLVRELVHRIEQLEGGAPTPMGGHPAEKARQAALNLRAQTASSTAPTTST